MPLIVEDGTGRENANAYTDVATVRAYWLDRGHVIGHTDPQVEAAIIIATQYVDLNKDFKGSRVYSDQALEFPRSPFVGVPMALQYAICEYAKRQLEAELQPDDRREPQVLSTTEKLDGVGSMQTQYAETTQRSAAPSFPLADGYLMPLLRPSAMNYLRR